ncbi:MAG: hypothetical protein PQJ49_12900 [Sphaerochaetaceae bacterium]|nr:hypothetical protein [Sphaerochaetaceae bacterium]
MCLQQGDFIKYSNPKYHDCNLYMVISHSCDIARDIQKEPYIELLPCHIIEEIDGNYSNGRTARKLHLSITKDNDKTFYCLNANEKLYVNKENFSYTFFSCINKSDISIAVLQNWLAFRYRREALPDIINAKLSQIKFKKILKKVKDEVRSIFVQLDEDKKACTILFIINSNFKNAELLVSDLISKLSSSIKDNKELSQTISFASRMDYDFNYDEFLDYAYFNFDYLCDE